MAHDASQYITGAIMLDLSAMDSIVAHEAKTASADSKHYIPFTKTEWATMQASVGHNFKPNYLKKVIEGIFSGAVVLVPKADFAIYDEVCPVEELANIKAERLARK